MVVSVGACSLTEAISNFTRVTRSARGLVGMTVSADAGPSATQGRTSSQVGSLGVMTVYNVGSQPAKRTYTTVP